MCLQSLLLDVAHFLVPIVCTLLVQVHLLHEDLIVEEVQKAVDERLQGCNTSRTYFTQALLPGAVGPLSSSQTREGKGKEKRTSVGSDVSAEGLDK